jgi:hypothetical protein
VLHNHQHNHRNFDSCQIERRQSSNKRRKLQIVPEVHDSLSFFLPQKYSDEYGCTVFGLDIFCGWIWPRLDDGCKSVSRSVRGAYAPHKKRPELKTKQARLTHSRVRQFSRSTGRRQEVHFLALLLVISFVFYSSQPIQTSENCVHPKRLS